MVRNRKSLVVRRGFFISIPFPCSACAQFVWQLPINIRAGGTDPIVVLQILSQNFNKKRLNNIWWVI